MQTPVNDPLSELARISTPVPNAGIIKNFFDMVFVDQHFVLVQAFVHIHLGKGQIRSVVAAESAFAEHTVTNDRSGVRPWYL